MIYVLICNLTSFWFGTILFGLLNACNLSLDVVVT